jgi:hypothetical protein
MDFGKVLEFISAMNREGVEYITFGAVALNMHGIVRATTDADFFIKPETENIERLKRALKSIWDDPNIDEIKAEELMGDYPAIAYGPPDDSFSMDFLTRLGEAYSYDTLPYEVIEYEGIPVRVVTAATLYEMRNTVRPKDKVDAHWLKEEFGFED